MLRGVCGPDTLTGQIMAYEPKTEAGKSAIAAGADPAVIEEQEADGSLVDVLAKKPDENVEKTAEEKAAEEAAAAEAAKGEAGEGGEPPLVDRTPQSMPIWKHKEELKKLGQEMEARHATELETALAAAASKQGGATSEDVGKLAEEFNVTPDVAGAMLDRMTIIIENRLGIGELKKDVDAHKQRDLQIAEQQGFESEWGAQATQDALKVMLGDRPLTAEVKDKLKKLAYTTTYAKYRLTDIIKLNPNIVPDAPTERRSAEGGRGGAGRGTPAPKSLDDLTPEQINAMSDKEFEELAEALGGKGNSRFTRTTKPSGKS